MEMSWKSRMMASVKLRGSAQPAGFHLIGVSWESLAFAFSTNQTSVA
jgi:hypothetical protein